MNIDDNINRRAQTVGDNLPLHCSHLLCSRPQVPLHVGILCVQCSLLRRSVRGAKRVYRLFTNDSVRQFAVVVRMQSGWSRASSGLCPPRRLLRNDRCARRRYALIIGSIFATNILCVIAISRIIVYGGSEGSGETGSKGSGKKRMCMSDNAGTVVLQTYVVRYASYSLPEPMFTNEDDMAVFLRDGSNARAIGHPPKEQLTGVVKYISEGLASHHFDCGWNSDLKQFGMRTMMPARDHRHCLCPLLVPEGGTFQHFIDGVLPKLMQVYELVTTADIVLLLHPPKDRIVAQMLSKLGFDSNSTLLYYGGYVKSTHQINTCRTPPAHPSLWRKARSLLGVSETHDNPSLVILLTRRLSRKTGRRIKNIEALTREMSLKYGSRLAVFSGSDSLSDTVQLFSQARVVVGVHGGAFYNVLFAPSNTTVVEIMPTQADGKTVPRYLSHAIIWRLATAIGQRYWRLAEKPVTSEGDVVVDVQRVVALVDHVLSYGRIHNFALDSRTFFSQITKVAS